LSKTKHFKTKIIAIQMPTPDLRVGFGINPKVRLYGREKQKVGQKPTKARAMAHQGCSGKLMV
jgi:hypothetical protein